MIRRPRRSTLFPYTTLSRSEWVVGTLRAAGIAPPDIGPVMQAHNLLGEPLWRPSAPKGFDGRHSGSHRKSTRLNSSHQIISYAALSLQKKKAPRERRRGSPR